MDSLPVINFDVVILGAGASGLMCALECAKRNRKVLVIDHAIKPGQKIRISGGGRCNFTNKNVQPHNYVSNNAHFCKSALSRYTQWDFIEMVQKHGIEIDERLHGQLFCKATANEIVHMLVSQCDEFGVQFKMSTEITGFSINAEKDFVIETDLGQYGCASVVVATGGLSYASIGATGIGYDIAQSVGIPVHPVTPGLVPLTWNALDSAKYVELSGIAIPATLNVGIKKFTENLLFTHRGISGPVVLQISNYWKHGESIQVNLLPGIDLFAKLREFKTLYPQKLLKTCLAEYLPKRVIGVLLNDSQFDKKMADCSDKLLQITCQQIQKWVIVPNDSEGYKKAEVTLGGVDCNSISSQTMEAINTPGLYFVGEVLDVTGWLGGFNLQWAWSSGFCAGQNA